MSSSNQQPAPSDAQLTAIFRQRQAELQALVGKITELEREAEEHGLVLETLRDAYKTTPSRKCFRLVGGVLVERTVETVLPQLENQYEQLGKVLETLTGQYKTREEEFAKWQRDNNVVVRQR
ncbi:hypothetical protein JCM6882_007173 [Rhodosporidiobolus microsporus]